MGEAKKRGTFEQRLAQSLERKKQEQLTRFNTANMQPSQPVVGQRRRPVIMDPVLVSALAHALCTK